MSEKSDLDVSYDALLAATEHKWVDVVIGGGTVKLREPTVPEAIMICRDFPLLRAVIMPKGETTDQDRGNAFFEALLASGPEAIATFIIYCAGLKRKPRQPMIDAILDKSDDEIQALIDGCRQTLGADGFKSFFGRARMYLAVIGMRADFMDNKDAIAA